MAKKKEQEQLPADVARQDSLSGMAKRLVNPAHIAELWRWAGDMVRQEGVEMLWRELDFRVSLAMHKDKWQHRADIPTRRQLKQQRSVRLQGPTISIVVPMYNTDPKFFTQMLTSILEQSYPNWQLVLADASDDKHREASSLAVQAMRQDKRVVYKKLEENQGIAGNTNEGFRMATGEFIALLDHDDVLYKNALYEVAGAIERENADFVYSDEIVLSADLKQLGGYHFKPDFAPDNLRGCNYITHLAVFSRELAEKAGFEERSEFDGAQDHDLILRLTEKAEKIVHIPKVLYIWRGHAASTAAGMGAKPYAIAAGERAVQAQLDRLGLKGSVSALPEAPGAFRVQYELTGHPLISVMIPSKDHIDDLDRCLSSLYAKAGYDNFEVLVLENNSTDPATFEYYKNIDKRYPRCRVERYEGGFNFSAVNNFGEKLAQGEQLLLLNNDIEILTDDFLKEMLSYSQREDVGCVGAKLFYPDDTIQHGGVILGINKTAGHSHKGHPRDAVGDLYRLITTQDFMAVTGACLMVKRELYQQCGGLDEHRFAVAYNDIDLCLKLWKQGLLNVYTPFAQAYHYESKSRGLDTTGANARRYEVEKQNFIDKYGPMIDAGDPYYNPHFNNKFENFGLR